jgi:hypothetical protein
MCVPSVPYGECLLHVSTCLLHVSTICTMHTHASLTAHTAGHSQHQSTPPAQSCRNADPGLRHPDSPTMLSSRHNQHNHTKQQAQNIKPTSQPASCTWDSLFCTLTTYRASHSTTAPVRRYPCRPPARSDSKQPVLHPECTALYCLLH